ncbi:biopolymer transporter ExbD [Opitutales bacterium ASA1]|jgi:biopolymer transport protein ExbD|uniref:ExbD/TolR family protein n=1 Tax=Congregicoccus parvus TaxID=3081749 RepID=UPI002B2CACD7|nr:biopolymer transporter ExbD [Opitutales bacterium ASA1]
MSRDKTLPDSDEAMTDINISPLIDMVFILLIFFIVTTVFVEETGVDVNKPQAVTIADLEKNSILIAITAGGNIVYGGQEIGIGGIRPVVNRLTAKNKDLPVIIQVDQAAEGSLVVRTIDEAKLGGAKKVSLSAERS